MKLFRSYNIFCLTCSFIRVGKEISSAIYIANIINGVVSEEILHGSIRRSIKGIGMAIFVDDFIVVVFVLFDFNVIHVITVGELLVVRCWLVRRVIEFHLVCVDTITSCWRASLDLDEVAHVHFLISLKPFVDESSVIDDIIIFIIDGFNFFIIGLVPVGEIIRFSLSSGHNVDTTVWGINEFGGGCTDKSKSSNGKFHLILLLILSKFITI